MDTAKWKKYLLNKYFIATAVFVVIIVFAGRYSLVESHRVKKQVNQLHAEEQALREAIVQDSAAAAALQNNLDAKERYGRENYYMKRADEDIFVIR